MADPYALRPQDVEDPPPGFLAPSGRHLHAKTPPWSRPGVLFQMGSGPVGGFAVTLTVGIITTVFTAITFTRLLIAYWVRRTRPTTVPI